MQTIIDNLQRFTLADFKKVFAVARQRQADEPILCNYTMGEIEYDMEAIVEKQRVTSIVFKWSYQGQDYQQAVDIEYLPSNLGKGAVPYFLCPHNGLYCRKLYTNGKVLVGRRAFYHTYENNIHSRTQREQDRYYKLICCESEPYRKRYYKGKLTPFGRKIERLEQELAKCKDKAIEDRMYQRKIQQQTQRGVK